MRRNHAFTVPEMLAVIALIMIIVAMLLPALQASRETTRRAICLSNQRQIALGALSYSLESQNVLPVYHTWATHYISDSVSNDHRKLLLDIAGRGSSSPEIYYCPSDRRLNADHPTVGWRSPNPGRFISYGPIGIWQQSVEVNPTWPKTYTAIAAYTTPSIAKQGNRPIKRHDMKSQLAMITDSQISWYAGSWGISFTYPGDGVWPEDPGYYSYYSFPHRENSGAWSGSNAVFFDGSGQWGRFQDIVDKTKPYPYGAKWIMHYQRGIYEGPVFW